ncbi:MAG: hypothetical protein JWQ47_2098 [Glaciihabitans sp.]|nr:hypothetical protein [Glaciihabitans sp.]
MRMSRVLPLVLLAGLTVSVLAGCATGPMESDRVMRSTIPTPASDTPTVPTVVVPAALHGELTRVVQTPAKSLETVEAKATAKTNYAVYAGCSSTRHSQKITYTVTTSGKFDGSGTIECNGDLTEDSGDIFAGDSTVKVSLGSVPKQVRLAYAIVAAD